MISILSLLSTCSTHPKIAEIVKSCLAFSPTGNVGSLMYGDRYLEYLNRIQGDRDGKFAAFEKGIHYTPDISAMLHVDQVWDMAINGHSPLHDPVRQSMLNAAEVVRKQLQDKLGTDLTVRNEYNPFFHTGNPVKLSSGNARSYRPWEDIKHVAAGKVPGMNREQREAWNAHVKRMIDEHMFPY